MLPLSPPVPLRLLETKLDILGPGRGRLASEQSLGPLAEQVGDHGPGGVGDGDGARHLVPLVTPVARLGELDPGGQAGLGAVDDALPIQVHPALRTQDVVDAAGHLVPHVALAVAAKAQLDLPLGLKLIELGSDPQRLAPAPVRARGRAAGRRARPHPCPGGQCTPAPHTASPGWTAVH